MWAVGLRSVETELVALNRNWWGWDLEGVVSIERNRIDDDSSAFSFNADLQAPREVVELKEGALYCGWNDESWDYALMELKPESISWDGKGCLKD